MGCWFFETSGDKGEKSESERKREEREILVRRNGKTWETRRRESQRDDLTVTSEARYSRRKGENGSYYRAIPACDPSLLSILGVAIGV